MQLTARLVFVMALGWSALAMSPASVQGATEGSARMTYFREQGKGTSGVTVVHPQADVAADVGSTLGVTAGYEMDVVTGASPRTYGVTTGTDAISGATAFSDVRQAGRGGLSYHAPGATASAAYSYGWENDYRSHTLTVAGGADFLDKNFTLGLVYTRNFDSVCDQNNRASPDPLSLQPLASSQKCFQSNQTEVVARPVDIHTFEPSLVWTATPRLLLQVGGTVQVLDGFQSNPYRSVLVGNQGRTPQERLPSHRQRYALFARANYALPVARAALSLMGRLYRDSWDLQAASADLTVNKYFSPALLIALRGRYHQQSGTRFFRNSFDYQTLGPAGQYWSGDRELSPLRTLLAGFKLAYLRRRQQETRLWYDELEFSAKGDALIYGVKDGAPNADRKLALVFSFGAALRF